MRHFVADEAEETATFIERFNKFFDILNVTNNKECYQKRKYDKLPYRWDKDQRLEVICYKMLQMLIVMNFI